MISLSDMFIKKKYTVDFELARAEENFNLITDTKIQINKFREVSLLLKEEIKSLEHICQITERKTTEFEKNAIANLERAVDGCLKFIFPERDYRIKIKLTESQGKNQASIHMMSGDKALSIKNTNGRMVRQTISTVLLLMINATVGVPFVFLDEALASGEEISLARISEFLRQYSKDYDTQLFIIEHKPALYENLSRREFKLSYTGPEFTGHMIVDAINDILEEIA